MFDDANVSISLHASQVSLTFGTSHSRVAIADPTKYPTSDPRSMKPDVEWPVYHADDAI